MISYTYSDIKEIYYKKYLFNIQQIILKGSFSYSFKDIEEIEIDEKRNPNLGKNFNNVLNKDSFLYEFNNDKIKLGIDIIENGTFWPLVCCENKIIEGAHRVYSLKLLNQQKKITRKFLCLEMPWNFEEYIQNKIEIITKDNLNESVEYYKLTSNNEIIKVQERNSYVIHENNFKISCFLLNNAIFTINKKYPNFIKPNPIFNDEKLFEFTLKERQNGKNF